MFDILLSASSGIALLVAIVSSYRIAKAELHDLKCEIRALSHEVHQLRKDARNLSSAIHVAREE